MNPTVIGDPTGLYVILGAIGAFFAGGLLVKNPKDSAPPAIQTIIAGVKAIHFAWPKTILNNIRKSL